MEASEFAPRFGGSEELGRFVAKEFTLIYHDDGDYVAVWRQPHGDEPGHGQRLEAAEATVTRLWWTQQPLKALYHLSGDAPAWAPSVRSPAQR